MNKPAPMTPAQRQAKRRQKLIAAAHELDALKRDMGLTDSSDLKIDTLPESDCNIKKYDYAPQQNPMWEVFPVRFARQIGPSVHVRASSRMRAIAAGRELRSIIHAPPARELSARRYYPLHDRQWGGYIQAGALVDCESQK